MTGYGSCAGVRQALGAYVLGSIEPADRAPVESHLAFCPACTEELAGLAGLPAVLRKVPPAEAEALATHVPGGDRPSDQMLGSLLSRAARVRQRRVVLAVAFSARSRNADRRQRSGQGLHGQRPPVTAAVWTRRSASAASAVSPRTHAAATIWYAPTAWGLQLAVHVGGVPAGTTCELKVISTRGQAITAGGWTIAGSPDTWYPASSLLALSQVRGFVISSGRMILVRVPLP